MSKNFKTNQTFNADFTVPFLLIVGIFAGYISYELYSDVSKPLPEDFLDFSVAEVDEFNFKLNIKRALLAFTTIIALYSFFSVYTILTSGGAVVIPPVDTATVVTIQIASQAHLDPDVVEVKLAQVSLLFEHDPVDKVRVLEYFKTFFPDLSKTPLSEKLTIDAKSYIVRLLLKAYEDPAYIDDVILPAARSLNNTPLDEPGYLRKMLCYMVAKYLNLKV